MGALVSLTFTVAEETGGTLTISDVDNPAVYVAQTNVAGTYGTFNLAADGTWSYTASSAYNNLNVGDSISDTFTVAAADGTTSTVQVTIHGTNDAAIVSSDAVVLTETNAPLATNGTLTISDVDNTAAFTPQTNTAGTYGTFSILANGNWSYTANSAYNNLNVGDSISDTFNVTAVDGTTTTVQVTIQGTNDAAIVSSAVVSANETDAPVALSGALTVTDVDNTAAFTPQTNVSGTYGTFSLQANGNWTFNAYSAFNNLNVGQSITDVFTVTAVDGTASSVQVTINGTNDAAVLSSATTTLIETNAPLSTNGTLTISDVDNAATFNAQSATLGSYGTFSINAAGNWSYTTSSAHNEFKAGNTYTDTFAVSSSDGTTTSVTIHITGTSDAPSGTDNTITMQQDGSHVFTAAEFGFSDVDVPADSLQAVKITTLPAAGVLTNNGVTVNVGDFISAADIAANKLVFTPVSGASGTAYASFTFQVQDTGSTTNGGQVLDPTPNTMTINVTAIIGAPTIISVPENAGGGINLVESTSAGGSVVNVAPPANAVAGDVITLHWGTQSLNYTLTTTDITNNLAAITVPTSLMNAQGDGLVNLTATATHNAQTGASSPVFTVNVDTHVATPDVQLVTDSGSSSTDRITNVGTFTVGAIESGATVEYSNDNGATWSTTSPALVQGPNTILVKQTDLVGNVSVNSVFNVIYDTVNPDAPNMWLTHDSGISNTDMITNQAGLSSSGLEAQAIVLYSSNGVSWSTTKPVAHEGSNTVYMRQIDVAGNIGTSSDISFIYDTQVELPSVVAQSTTLNSPTISGSFSSPTQAGDMLTVSVGGQTYTTSPAAGSTSWSIPLAAPLSVGTHNVVATMSDAAGNSRTDVSVSELVILSLTPESDTLFDYIRPDNSYQAGDSSSTSGDQLSNTSRNYGGFLYNTIDFETPKSLYAPSWSWSHRPDFVVLPPVVYSFRGIVADITGMHLDLGRFSTPYSSDVETAAVASLAVTKNVFDLKYEFTNINSLEMSYATEICFEDKVQELLSDFNIFK